MNEKDIMEMIDVMCERTGNAPDRMYCTNDTLWNLRNVAELYFEANSADRWFTPKICGIPVTVVQDVVIENGKVLLSNGETDTYYQVACNKSLPDWNEWLNRIHTDARKSIRPRSTTYEDVQITEEEFLKILNGGDQHDHTGSMSR